LDAAGVEADELTVHTPDLDDVFFALTGHTDHAPGQTLSDTDHTPGHTPGQTPNQPKETIR
ncbi:ABC transporter, partial [Streptomyces sp. NPDC001658]